MKDLLQLPPERRWKHPDLPRRRKARQDDRKPYQKILDKSINEQAFQNSLLEVAALHGWMVHHETDSRWSFAGFPDLVCAHPDHGVVFIELKSETNNLKPDQYDWRDYLVAAGAFYYVFRPRDRFVADELFTKGKFPPMERYMT